MADRGGPALRRGILRAVLDTAARTWADGPDQRLWPELYDHPELVDQWELVMHLISAHADPLAVCRSYADNLDQHEHEHRGPGTIRNHSPASRFFNAVKIELVLEECEDSLG